MFERLNHFSPYIAVLLISQVILIPAFGKVKFTNELKWQQLSPLWLFGDHDLCPDSLSGKPFHPQGRVGYYRIDI